MSVPQYEQELKPYLFVDNKVLMRRRNFLQVITNRIFSHTELAICSSECGAPAIVSSTCKLLVAAGIAESKKPLTELTNPETVH